MKNKKIIFRSFLALLFAGLVLIGCKKKDTVTPVTPVDDAAQQTQSAADQAKAENESDQAMDDCNSTMQGVSTTRGTDAFSFPCGVTIDTINKAAGLIVLTYNGNNCAGTKTRSGSISIQISMNGSVPHKWRDQNAKVTLTFNSYKVTNLLDNKSITIGGTHTIINSSGGAVSDVLNGGAVTHLVRANMTLLFDGTSIGTWGVHRSKMYNSITPGVIQVTVSGDSSILTVTPQFNYLSMWGTNRAGENFKISMPSIVYNVYDASGVHCLYKPLSGQRNHYGVAHEIDCTYGVDVNGNHDNSSTCPHGWKANWTNAQGVAKQVIVPY